jgi:hypothetical protein
LIWAFVALRSDSCAEVGERAAQGAPHVMDSRGKAAGREGSLDSYRRHHTRAGDGQGPRASGVGYGRNLTDGTHTSVQNSPLLLGLGWRDGRSWVVRQAHWVSHEDPLFILFLLYFLQMFKLNSNVQSDFQTLFQISDFPLG